MIIVATAALPNTWMSRSRTNGPDPEDRAFTTTYAPDKRLGLWVPARMAEVYETQSGTITGEATYTNFRRFETEVRFLGVK